MKRSPLEFSLVLALSVLLVCVSASPQAQTPGERKATVDNKPKTTITPEQATDPTDPLFGVGALPPGPVSLVGGTLDKIDRVRNHVGVRPFGDQKKMNIFFDERTHIYRDGVETTERGLRRGDRVYVDTMLDGGRLFARNIRVVTNLKPADARGQIVAYEPSTGTMTVRDDLSGTEVTFRVTQQTAVKRSSPGSTAELVPGALVNVHLEPGERGHSVARDVSVLAAPGSTFTFVGKVRHLDMRAGTLVVENQSDNKSYELEFDRGTVGPDVMVGSDVVVNAEFVGRGYRARTVSVSKESAAK